MYVYLTWKLRHDMQVILKGLFKKLWKGVFHCRLADGSFQVFGMGLYENLVCKGSKERSMKRGIREVAPQQSSRTFFLFWGWCDRMPDEAALL